MPIRLQPLTRDLVMFLAGLTVFLNEAFIRKSDRPNVLYASLALMGVAAYLRGIAVGAKHEK